MLAIHFGFVAPTSGALLPPSAVEFFSLYPQGYEQFVPQQVRRVELKEPKEFQTVRQYVTPHIHPGTFPTLVMKPSALLGEPKGEEKSGIWAPA